MCVYYKKNSIREITKIKLSISKIIIQILHRKWESKQNQNKTKFCFVIHHFTLNFLFKILFKNSRHKNEIFFAIFLYDKDSLNYIIETKNIKVRRNYLKCWEDVLSRLLNIFNCNENTRLFTTLMIMITRMFSKLTISYVHSFFKHLTDWRSLFYKHL